jgi:hypothetical protein
MKFADYLDDINFKSFHVLCLQLIRAYISKKLTGLRSVSHISFGNKSR